MKSPSFTSEQAIEMMQTLYTMDYSRKAAGSRPAAVDDCYHPTFSLDMLAFIGRPLKPITKRSDQFFDNITVTFRNWRSPYSSKHLHGVLFDLEHRTFRIATAASREAWFIVMHPAVAQIRELPRGLPGSQQEHRKRVETSSRSSGMLVHHARQLASFITQVFLTSELLGLGVERSWTLGSSYAEKMPFNKWTVFQEVFMEAWPTYAEEHAYDEFWTANQPAFHAYDYGADIEIEVTEEVKSLPKETRLRPTDEEEEDDRSSDNEESEEEDEAPPIRVEEMEVDVDHRAQPAEWQSPGRFTASLAPEEIDYESLYAGRLRQLRTELQGKYMLDNIGTVSYALAANINCLDGQSPDLDEMQSLCLLANRNAIDQQYRRRSDYTFYPMGYHLAFGNFSSSKPPEFLEDRVLVMRENMSYQNDGADPLSFGYFQGYSNIKRSIRHDPRAFLATKGITTAALTLPSSEADVSSRVKGKRQRLFRWLQGELTPNDPESSIPFAREKRQLEAAIGQEEYAFRMEQVVSVNIARLSSQRRTFSTVLNPIFQLIRFFLKESACYAQLLHTFQPVVFPGVLCSFAKLFSLAMDEMLQRYKAGGSKGLSAALSEGVAAIDRLGSYCFTGFPTSLMGSVLGPLGTLDGIQAGAWPYINPRILDLCKGRESLSLSRWPRSKDDGRPILMHIASIGFHYGPEVAASRQSNVWFQELGGMSVGGPKEATSFLTDLFHDLWIPQMVSFISFQFYRGIGGNDEDPETTEQQRELVQRWTRCSKPFAWRYVLTPVRPRCNR
jgi:hypothetical protein